MQSVGRDVVVKQFNMLADSLVSGGFSNVESKHLEWKHRKPLIISILKDGHPDIICIEECDKFDELYEELMDEYRGNFVKKYGDDHKDGVATFIKKTKIEIEETVPLRLNTGRNDSQVALIHRLCINKFKFILVATHLKSNEFENKNETDKSKFEKIREDQVRVICDWVSKSYPLILCGDLNEEPGKPALNYLFKSNLELKSAYADVKDRYTTYKKRKDAVKCIEEDYILYSRDFKVVEILELPPKTDFLPNKKYPSDHVYLMAKFCF